MKEVDWVVLTDLSRSRFYVQQKDEHYTRHPFGYGFFGGESTQGEDGLTTLSRELREELSEEAYTLISPGDAEVFQIVFDGEVQRPPPCRLVLYERRIDDSALEKLAVLPIHEGLRGVLVSKDEMLEIDWIWNLHGVVKGYLERIPLRGS